MNIAIVENEPEDRICLRNRLTDLLQKYHTEPVIAEFKDAESFLSDFEPELYDLCFMDIFLEGMNGMDAARQIHRLDPELAITFLTGSDEFVYKGYEVHALRYLLKPLKDEDLHSLLAVCMEQNRRNRRRLSVPCGKKTLDVPYHRILYVISARNTTELHLSDTYINISARHTFSSIVEPLLADYRFISCARGVVVNLAHVKDIHRDCFIMSNGNYVPISRRQYAAAHDSYIDFQFDNLV